MRLGSSARQRGAVLLWVLAVLAGTGVALAAVGTQWSLSAQRDRENELLRVGAAYAQAITSYRRLSPGSAARSPRSLEALLLDDRYIQPQRHLRRLYPDPIDPRRPWGLVTDAEGRILGVYSQSPITPLRRVAVWAGELRLPAAQTYSDWKFVAKADDK
jgi:type II secretory pathway pseudopilin PulG